MKKPNILFIITDHQAWHGHFTEGGIAPIKLPIWEAFCQKGVLFERAYTSAPICTPSRSSMMTGLYPSRHGLIFNTESPNVPLSFKPGQKLYNHYLEEQGYCNAYIGKWHCDYYKSPQDFGCEGWSLQEYGKIYMSDKYKEYADKNGWGDAKAKIEYDLNNPDWPGQILTLHNESPWHFMNGCGILQGPAEAHEEQFISRLCIEKLHKLSKSDTPFSLVASFWGPHHAFFPSEEFAKKVDPKDIKKYPSFDQDIDILPPKYVAHRDKHHPGVKKIKDWSTWQIILARAYAQALQLDSAIGDLLNELKSLGLEENTMVIWCADHGDAVASHGGMWDKAGTMTQEVMRIPMAIRWPAGFQGGRIKKEFACNMDATATMLDAAGSEIPADMHSHSLLPLCKGDDFEWKDDLVLEHAGHGPSVLLQRMIVFKNFKYVAAEDKNNELYDLEKDPYELNNLINNPDYDDIKKDLFNRIMKHINDINDVMAKEKLAGIEL